MQSSKSRYVKRNTICQNKVYKRGTFSVFCVKVMGGIYQMGCLLEKGVQFKINLSQRGLLDRRERTTIVR